MHRAAQFATMASVAASPLHPDEPDSQLPGRRTGRGAESLWDHLNRDTRRKAAAAGAPAPLEGTGATPLDDCLKLQRALIEEEQELLAVVADARAGNAGAARLEEAHANVLALRALAEDVIAAALAHLRQRRGG